MGLEISPEDRFILQNVFNNQKAKRAAYLKTIGFEMDPSDDNQFRPLNSSKNAPYAGEVDPGVEAWFKKGFLKEIFQDLVSDMAVDYGQSAAEAQIAIPLFAKSVAAGASTAAVPGALAGGLASLVGIMGMRAGSNMIAEEAKGQVADLILHMKGMKEKIPQDRQAEIIQSAIAGIAPAMMGAIGRKVSSGVSKFNLARQFGTLKKALEKFPGMNQTVVKEVMVNPEKYEKALVEGSDARFKPLVSQLFGFEDDQLVNRRQIMKSSINNKAPLGKFLKDKAGIAEKVVEENSADPSKSISLREILAPFEAKMHMVKKTGSLDSLSNEEFADLVETPLEGLNKNADDYKLAIYKKLRDFQEKAINQAKEVKFGSVDKASKVPMRDLLDVKLPFGQVRDFVDEIQEAAYRKDEPYTSFLKEIAGKQYDEKSGVGHLVQLLDDRGGDSYRKVYDDLEKGMKVGNNLKQTVNVKKLKSAYIMKNDEDAKSLVQSVGELDDLVKNEPWHTGQRFSDQFNDLNFKRAMENTYENVGAPFGSGPTLAEVIAETSEGAAKGGLLGKALKMIPGVGNSLEGVASTAGAARAAYKYNRLRDPEKVIEDLIAAKTKSQSIPTSSLLPRNKPQAFAESLMGREASQFNPGYQQSTVNNSQVTSLLEQMRGSSQRQENVADESVDVKRADSLLEQMRNYKGNTQQ